MRTPTLVLAIGLGVVYAAGLHGPFVLDDHVNLAPVWHWLSGQADLSQLFQNPSSPVGRPLALLSFAANAALGGASPFGFKLTNLLLHAGAVLLVGMLLLRISSMAPAQLSTRAAWILTALWAMHPQHVSTILYVVQRMALLGALAQFSAVLIYLQARQRLASDPRSARWMLFLAFPLLVGVGILGKETAALAPLLCATLEISLYPGKRPPSVRWFFLAFLALPLALGAAAFALGPDRVLASYDGREFDLTQRVLTQARVLLDYASGWFWPMPDRLALYRDGYLHSTALLQPASTAFAILLWLSLAACAIAWRQRRPLFFAGVGWFFAAHALESTWLPLEPYFEHRNYVASLGLLLAAWALLQPLLARLPARSGQGIAIVAVATLGLLTGVRAWNWADFDRLLASEGPPAGEISRRLQVDRAIRGVERGDRLATDQALATLAEGNAGDRAAGALWQAILSCDRDAAFTSTQQQQLSKNPPAVLTHNHLSWLALLVDRAAQQRCPGLRPADLDRLMQDWRQSAQKPLTPASLARFTAMQQRLRAAPQESSH